jgi:hypothetical protein
MKLLICVRAFNCYGVLVGVHEPTLTFGKRILKILSEGLGGNFGLVHVSLVIVNHHGLILSASDFIQPFGNGLTVVVCPCSFLVKEHFKKQISLACVMQHVYSPEEVEKHQEDD